MQTQPVGNNVQENNFHSLIKIDNVFFHSFSTQNRRQLIDITSCEIIQYSNIQATSLPNNILKLGNFEYKIQNTTFVKAKFQNLLTYVFESKQNPDTIYLFSIQIYNPSIQAFTEKMKQSAYIVDYKTDLYEKTEIKIKIQKICGGELTQQMVQDIGAIGGILKTVGNIIGSVSKNIADPTLKAEQYYKNTLQNVSQKYISDINKNRWNNLKQTASKLNQTISSYYKPFDDAFRNLTTTIGQNFYKSQNKYVQNMIKYGKATAAKLNNGYKTAQSMVIRTENKPQQMQESSTNNIQM